MIKPRSLKSLTLFFPCYNEAENVAQMIKQSVETVSQYGCDYEVLVVDDGSTDATSDIVQQKIKENSRIRLIRHETNQGYGAAVATGLLGATMDLVFMTDGDNQFHISDIEKLFSKIDSCDVVAGYRIQRMDQAHRRLNGKLWTQLNRILFQLPVRDVDCAFKLYRRKKLEGLKIKSKQLLVHAEVLARLKKRGCVIEEIGIPHYPRTAGKATATGLGRILKTFIELAGLYSNIAFSKE